MIHPVQSANQKPKNSEYAIIAGRGLLPKIIAEKMADPFILSFGSDSNEFLKADFLANMGQISEIVEQLQQAGAKKLVFAGSIKKPNLKDLKLDKAATKLLGKAAFSKLFGKSLPGDDALFRMIIAFLEKQGFEVVGVDDIAPELLAEEGALGEVIPDPIAMADILLGCKHALDLGEKDLGQAVICAGGEVIAVEDVNGTDDLMQRAAEKKPQNAVLVKCKKPQQERRIDLPSIGVQTIEQVVKMGYAGIAVEAKHSLIIEKDAVRKLANEAGIFVFGF